MNRNFLPWYEILLMSQGLCIDTDVWLFEFLYDQNPRIGVISYYDIPVFKFDNDEAISVLALRGCEYEIHEAPQLYTRYVGEFRTAPIFYSQERDLYFHIKKHNEKMFPDLIHNVENIRKYFIDTGRI